MSFLHGWYESQITQKNLTGQILRRFRRFYYTIFKPKEIAERIKTTRKGECHQCGLCCQLIYKCPMLGKDPAGSFYCRIYGNLRPGNCHIYPFDQRDSEIASCGYTFDTSATS